MSVRQYNATRRSSVGASPRFFTNVKILRLSPDLASVSTGSAHHRLSFSSAADVQRAPAQDETRKAMTQFTFARVMVLTAGLAAVSTLSGPAGATDQGSGANAGLEAPTASTRTPGRSLNLLAGPRERQPIVRVRSMGQGSWICSPAGSGQRSRCYRN
jgi:hypothetical protein